MLNRGRLASAASCLLVGALLASCSADEETGPSPGGTINALFASYDVAVGLNPRVTVGLVDDDYKQVSFGTAEMRFAYVGDGTSDGEPEAAPAGAPVTAQWIALPGQDLPASATTPRLVDPTEGTGVYAARDVRFDRPGFWEVRVEVDVDGKPRTTKTAFEVQPEHQVIAVGEEAPATDNPLPGATGVDSATIDSRAEDSGTVPDVALHSTSVADAIRSGLPTMVVVATPVFCQSRFCGPITDAVEELAEKYEGRANFVHLEVWEDYEAERLTTAAEEWIVPADGEGGSEPWVFLVDSEGVVVDRWDNVASEPELRGALDDELR